MQINRCFVLLCCLVSVTFPLKAQELLDIELSALAKQFSIEVSNKMQGQNIAVADFVDDQDNPSPLGRYLAEEFSYTLVNAATNFKVIDRTQLRTLLKEAGLGDKGMLDPNTVKTLGKLEGISAVVYGKLTPVGNVVRVFIKVVVLETQVNEIIVRGSLTKTPTIGSLLNEADSKKADIEAKTKTDQSTAASAKQFVHQHISLTLKQCRYKNGYLDCEFEVISIGKNDNFSVQTSDTQLTLANEKSYRASSLSIGSSASSILVNASLQANVPAILTVRFSGVPTDTNLVEQLVLNCKSYSAFSFKAYFNNISIP
jgi:curli biogenesis system outer membrane secretion channel CsgG